MEKIFDYLEGLIRKSTENQSQLIELLEALKIEYNYLEFEQFPKSDYNGQIDYRTYNNNGFSKYYIRMECGGNTQAHKKIPTKDRIGIYL